MKLRALYRSPILLWIALTLLFLGLSPRSHGQAVDLANRPVAEIRVEGLVEIPEPLVHNQIRVAAGDPYDPTVVQQDIVRLRHLGRFDSIVARTQVRDDGSVILTYVFSEQRALAEVQVVGNKHLKDQELLSLVMLRAGDAVDPSLIDRGIDDIKEAYQKKGYFLADVSVDQQLLRESNILLLRVREGPKVRIKAIRFEGNTLFTDKQLRSKLKSKTHIFILRDGVLSRETLDNDVAIVRQYYQDHGYLDVQVGRRIDLSPKQNSAVAVFFVDEGRQYLVSDLRVEGNTVFSTEDILQTLTLKNGDVFSADQLKKSEETLTERYGKLGYLETLVQIERLFHPSEPRVNLVVRIDEVRPYVVGTVTITGNQLTKDKVVRRQVRGMNPGRRFDRAGIKTTEQRLSESSLFETAHVTVQDDISDEIRDVVVEVKEKNTGTLSFGAGVSSDLGVAGAIDLSQRNFDIADWPESMGEFFTGKAFRGAGQYFGISLQPGTEYSRYAVSFREPYMLDSNYFLDLTASHSNRDRDNWDENRTGGTTRIGQRFGDVWQGSIDARLEQVNVDDIEDDAPVDVFEVEGDNFLTTLGLSLTRNTTDSRIQPSRGSVLTMGISRAGALGGDFDFNKVSAALNKYWTVDEDFFGRKTILSFNTETGYIFDGEASIFERFYAGGHRTLRGFEYRGVGPRGERNDTGELGDDAVGGEFLFLAGTEYNFPIFQEIVRGVVFIDSGTVDEDVSFSKYRVSVGAGLRLLIPFLGQAPFALDFAYPIAKQDEDETQFFSFDLAVPF